MTVSWQKKKEGPDLPPGDAWQQQKQRPSAGACARSLHL